MDELVHHCVRELSFDGDLGCSVSRLRDFISEFHLHNPAHPQTVDDAYCAFVWSLIVQHPAVRIGTVPPGITTEVYIAPQTSAKRKAQERGEELKEAAPASTLDLIDDAKVRSLEDLQVQYGDSLRMAVDPETSLVAITGSHIRPSSLSPMVYTALQLITRGRDSGISVMELGKKSGYDQKTCHYLVNQLLKLEHIVKIRRGGVGSHFCIHKYFYDRSPLWKQIREEEERGQNVAEDVEEDQGDLGDDGQSQISGPSEVHFDPIDARHLSSLPLVKARIVKLLKACKNNMHVSQNLILSIGFSHPTKTDRRFFSTRLNDLISQGVIEKLYVPNPNSRLQKRSYLQCVRLVTTENRSQMGDLQGAIRHVAGEDTAHDEMDADDVDEVVGLKINLTLHKQMVNLVEAAGTKGMTLNELSENLGQFDKRTIELLMTRLEKYPPPPHLSDLGVAEMMETHGRERRHRYYTVAAYRELVAQENLHDSESQYAKVDFSSVGDFLSVDASLFYEDEATLIRHQDLSKELKQGKVSGSGKPRGRPLGASTKGKGKTPKKAKANKVEAADGCEEPRQRKRKREMRDIDGAFDDGAGPSEASASKQRGRPPKRPKVEQRVGAESTNPGDDAAAPVISQEAPQSKKRGRPSKAKKDSLAGEDVDVSIAPPVPAATQEVSQAKKRGRPSKVKKDSLTSEGGTAAGIKETPQAKKRGRPPKARKESLGGEVLASAIDESSAPRKRGRPSNQSTKIPRKSKAAVNDVDLTGHGDGDDVEPGFNLLPMIDAESGPKQTDDALPPHAYEEALSPLTELSEDPPECSGLSPASREASIEMGRSQTVYDLQVRPPQEPTLIPIDPVLMAFNSSEVATTTPQILTTVFDLGSSSGSGIKRDIAESNVDAGPSKRRKASGPPQIAGIVRPKANVSQLRRENEIYQLLEQLGGIAVTSGKDFLDAHVEMIQRMTSAGEPTSAPVGSRLDRRTIEATLNNLESRGKVKTLKTIVKLPTGSHRPARISYLPALPQEQLDAFLSVVGRTLLNIQPPSIKKVEEVMEFVPGQNVERAALPLQLLRLDKPSDKHDERWARNIARADQLFSYDDETIRNVLLTENHTRAQMYGFKVGKMIRARELHLYMLGRIALGEDSPRIVSLEHRIVHFSYFFTDLPIQHYFKIVSALAYDERLSELLKSDSGRRTPVGDIDQELHTILQVGRARARTRVLDILEMLRDLEVVTPLEPSTVENAHIACIPKADYPPTYSVASLEEWTPQSAPLYWHFHASAPIRLWGVLGMSPPLWKEVPLANDSDGLSYWQELQRVSTDGDYARQLMCPDDSETQDISSTAPVVSKSIRRTIAWSDSYVLSWHQNQYLKKFVDLATGLTPLEYESSPEHTLQRISWVVCAPLEVIRDFFTTARSRRLLEIEAAHKKAQRKAAAEQARHNAEAKALLAQKSAEARAKREQEWELLVQHVHPDSLPESATRRLRLVKSRFLQSGPGTDNQQWEEDILRAIRDAKIAAEKILPRLYKDLPPPPVTQEAPKPAPRPPPPTHPPSLIAHAPEESVEILVSKQPSIIRNKPQVKEKKPRKKRGEKGKEKEASEDEKPQKRNRFHWTKEYDELAKDASVIIKARCRGLRIDWAAYDQVFPCVLRNSVRQRVTNLREQPGAATYLQRLEEKWYDLWSKYRGSVFLPDNDPITPSNFDLVRHIDFLRRHIDKNAIRVGFEQSSKGELVLLPASLELLQQNYDVVDKPINEPAWDFVWNTAGEEGREKNMARQPYVMDPEVSFWATEDLPETVHLAESALKIVLGTPNEVYDPDVASRMLHQISEEPVSKATANMLDRGVLSKLIRDPLKPRPGRTLKISEMNQNALGGSFSSDVFQDASALEGICSQQDGVWREWPLLATDGDVAALLELAAECKVEFKIDTTRAQAARPAIDWNSKKADDDQIETAISVRFHDIDDSSIEPPSSRESSPPQHEDTVESVEMMTEHEKTFDGSVAACRQSGAGAIDCQSCLDAQLTRLRANARAEQCGIIDEVSRILHEAGPTGVSVADLLTQTTSKDSAKFHDVIRLLSEASIPLLHRVGYAEIMLVSSTQIRHWTVVISEDPLVRTFPRRWLDIFGKRVKKIWEAALRAVMSVVILRPGIPQGEIRWRLRAVYDRQEVNDILRFLRARGFLEPRVSPDLQLDDWDIAAPNNAQEKMVMWFVGKRHWYQV
ncbi:hypothetical protein NEOLEDRAFT_1138493 [Neolentinus lepideus HHB14362 ss-1]|uniref:Uncharacterized protein n=1 Tax=Neolentinus lepideus HHB14362 ss-1 TaxID=1314782 RepID=A0A165QAJ2_9AGAM|nr:hypothetical protein NEOLEDRAFT_1138493 [Neolentinus lepideus HHB14362 ss-1]